MAGINNWAQQGDPEKGRNGETAMRGQGTDHRLQMVQSTEYRTAEQGTAE